MRVHGRPPNHLRAPTRRGTLRSTDSEIEFGSGLVLSNKPSSGRMMRKNDEIVGGEDPRRDHVAAFWRLRAEIAEADHGRKKMNRNCR